MYTMFDGASRSMADLVRDETAPLTAVQAYSCVPYLYRAVDLRAKAVAGMPFCLTRLSDGADLGDTPDGRRVLAQIRTRLYQTEADLCLHGEAFWLKQVSRAGAPLAPRRVLPRSMLPRYDAVQGIVGYERSTAAGTHCYAPDEVIAFGQPSVVGELGAGTPPAQVALAAAAVLYQLDRFSEGFFRRGAIRATLLTVEGNPSRADLERLEIWWRRLVTGMRRAWESVAIRSSVRPVVIGEGLEALANQQLTAQLRQDVGAALGVPETLLTANAANYATSLADRLNFYDMTIVPQTLLIAESLNTQWLASWGMQFAFMPQQLELYQAAEVQKAQQIAALVGEPVLTVNEGRALLGYAPLEQAAGGGGVG